MSTSALVTVQFRWGTWQIGCKGWPQPLGIKITTTKGGKFRDFENRPLITGWPLNIFFDYIMIFSFFQQKEDHTTTTRRAYGTNFFAKGSPSISFFEVTWHDFPLKVSKRATLQNIRRQKVIGEQRVTCGGAKVLTFLVLQYFPLLYALMQFNQ